MKVLLVGSGGREHALAWKLAQSPLLTRLYCAPGNAGIAQAAECVPVAATDFEGLVRFAQDTRIDFAVIAADAQLVGGLWDVLEAAGVPALAIGRTGGTALSLPGEPALAVADLRKIHEDWLPTYMAGKAA